ncbi:MAG: hypothetical protein LBR15_06180 [Methanobrevibacter sp.]|jgi:hypothetical protein|nr:hypothetical protein [Candidatus Methanovirga australis]
MFKNLIKILMLVIVLTSVSNVNAGKIDIDGYGGLVHNFVITDMTTGTTIWDRDVAAGDGHSKNYDLNNLKYHQIMIKAGTCNLFSWYWNTLLINMYDGSDINLYIEKNDGLTYTIGNTTGNFKGSKTI